MASAACEKSDAIGHDECLEAVGTDVMVEDQCDWSQQESII
jgi:hypothetical protein